MLTDLKQELGSLQEGLRAARKTISDLEVELDEARNHVAPKSKDIAPIDFFTWCKMGVKIVLGERVYGMLRSIYRRLRRRGTADARTPEAAEAKPELASIRVPRRDRGLRAEIAGRRVIALLACPRCDGGALREGPRTLLCENCRASFPVVQDVPVFLDDPREYVDRTHQTGRTNPYSQSAKDLILSSADGVVLDLGAGHPEDEELFSNVVRQEILHYPSTDVVSNTSRLPFRNGVFDAVVCESVFEHVPDPVLTAEEIYRVLKPGGRIRVDSAFLQPFHADPSHFYNMTVPGLERTFRRFRKLRSGVDSHQTASFTIRILLRQYAAFVRNTAVTEEIERLLSLPLEDIDRELTQEQHQVIGAGVFFEGVKDVTGR